MAVHGPTWYDVLGVERDATHEEVRAAWRDATDRATPGSGQFRSFNEAAETLLDPQRRAAYDAQLPAEEPEEPVEEPVEPVVPMPAPTEPETQTQPEARELEPAKKRRLGLLGGLLGANLLVTAVALVLGLVLVAYAVVGGLKLRETRSLDSAVEQAPVAAEQAAEAMLSYDYRELPADQARAEGFLTGDFKKEFTKNFTQLGEQEDGSDGPAVQTKAVVKAQSVGSGVVDVDPDGRTVRVLVFVNQTSEKEGQDPQVFLNRVAMTMKERDGRWLVSDLRSY